MEHNSAAKVGVASFIMIIFIALLLLWKSGIFLRATGYKIIGQFQSINGLLKGAEVRYRGYNVGRVSAVLPNPQNIKVHFWVGNDIEIPERSELRVIFDGLIGEKYIDIQPNIKSKRMIQKGGILYGYATSGLADFVDLAAGNLSQTKEIFESLKDILASDDVTAALKNTFLKLDSMMTSLSDLLAVAESEDVRNITKNFASFSTELAKISKSLNDKNILDKVNQIVTNIAIITEEFGGVGVDESETANGGVLKGVRKIGQTLSSLRLKSTTGLRYYVPEKRATFFSNLDIHLRDSFFRLGFGNRPGETKLLQLQQGFRFNDAISGRVGIFYAEPGLGLDLRVLPLTSLSLEVFNLNEVEFDITGRLHITNQLNLAVGLSKNPLTEAYKNYRIGLTYSP